MRSRLIVLRLALHQSKHCDVPSYAWLYLTQANPMCQAWGALACTLAKMQGPDMPLCSADPAVIAKHQPMVWGIDRLATSYTAITARPSYAKPAYVLTFNEPNYNYAGTSPAPSNIVDPVSAAGLWPQLQAQYDPLGIGLIAPSPIDCAGDPKCQNVGTAIGWLSAFQSVSFSSLDWYRLSIGLLQICCHSLT